MKHIEFVSWSWSCGDGCCDEWGIELRVDGKQIVRTFEMTEADHLIELLKAIGVSFETVNIEYWDTDINDDVPNNDYDYGYILKIDDVVIDDKHFGSDNDNDIKTICDHFNIEFDISNHWEN